MFRLTTEVHSAYEVREGLKEKEKESVIEAASDLEAALAGRGEKGKNLTDLRRSGTPSSAPSIKSAIPCYATAPGENEQVRELVQTASPRFVKFLKQFGEYI